MADDDAERPATVEDEVSNVERHDEQRDSKVSERQRHNVEVLDSTQRPVREHRTSSGTDQPTVSSPILRHEEDRYRNWKTLRHLHVSRKHRTSSAANETLQ